MFATGVDEMAPPLNGVPPPADAAAGALNNLGTTAAGIPGQVAPPMDATARAIQESMDRAQADARAGGQGVHDGVTGPLPAMQQTAPVSSDTLPPTAPNAMVGATAAAQTGSARVKTAVETGFNNPANAAQITRRSRADAELLEELLRSQGYYDADVEPRTTLREGSKPDGRNSVTVRLFFLGL